MAPLVVDIPVTTAIPFTTSLTVDEAAVDLAGEDATLQVPGNVEVVVEPVNEGFLLTGLLQVSLELSCSRCLKPVVWQVSERFRVVLSREPAGSDVDDDWVFFPRGEHEFDLGPLVRELIIVALPAKPLCMARCRGLCPICGQDRNTTLCGCARTTIDPRWAALASLAGDAGSFDGEEANHGIAEEEDFEEQA